MEATLHQLKLKVGEETVNELLRVLCKIASAPNACLRCGLDGPAASSSGPRAEPEEEQLVGGFSKDDLMHAIAFDFDDEDKEPAPAPVPAAPKPAAPKRKKKFRFGGSDSEEEQSAVAKSQSPLPLKKTQKKKRRVVSSEDENAGDEDIFA